MAATDPDPAPLTPAEIESGIAWYEGMLRSGGLDAQARAILRAGRAGQGDPAGGHRDADADKKGEKVF